METNKKMNVPIEITQQFLKDIEYLKGFTTSEGKDTIIHEAFKLMIHEYIEESYEDNDPQSIYNNFIDETHEGAYPDFDDEDLEGWYQAYMYHQFPDINHD